MSCTLNSTVSSLHRCRVGLSHLLALPLCERGSTRRGREFDTLLFHLSTLNSSLCDSDVNPLAPICIGMDYNANINWIVAGQPEGRRLNIIKSFYVKFERKIPALVEEFCNYYAHHQNKTFIGWCATNLRSEAGKWKMSILAILCDTMKSTF